MSGTPKMGVPDFFFQICRWRSQHLIFYHHRTVLPLGVQPLLLIAVVC